MYRVAAMVRATRTALSEDLTRPSQQHQLGLRLLHHSCACQKKRNASEPRTPPQPPPPASSQPPLDVPRPKRLASDLGSPAAIARFEAQVAARKAKSKKRAEERTERYSDGRGLPMFMWRRLPPEQRWAHLREGLFPLAEATLPDSSASDAATAAAAAPSSSSLLSGLSRSSNLFSSRATIHRIIGFESDLILEAKRDNMLSAEVALVGRSNVGKSSLLNALLVNGGLRKQLATTSKTPGRTQQLFMFSFERDRNVRVVDCPGYGYAQASLKRVAGWNALMGTYLRKRYRQGILKRVLVLVDARRGIGPLDEKFMQFLEGCGIAYQIVMTKVDKLGPMQFETAMSEVRKHLQAMPQGIFKTDAKRREYEKRMEQADAEEAKEAKDAAAGKGDGAAESKEESAAAFVEGSGQPARESDSSTQLAEDEEEEDDDDNLPAFSCSIPLIHVVSARERLGIVALQNALTKMLHHEPNLRGRQYEPEGSEEGAEVGRLASGEDTIDARQARERFLPPGAQSLDAAEEDDGEDGPFVLEAADEFEDDGMDNHPLAASPDDDGMDNAYEEEEAEIDEQFVPPIPVAHFEPPTDKDRARVRAQRRSEMEQTAAAFSSSPKRAGAFGRPGGPSRRPSSPGRFKRSFSTSTTLFAARKPRAASPATTVDAAEAAADAVEQPKTKAARKPSKPRSAKAKAATDSDAAPAPVTGNELAAAAVVPAKKASKPRAKKASAKSAAAVDAATETVAETTASSAPAATAAGVAEIAADPSASAAVPAAASVHTSSGDAHLGAIYQKKSQREHILDRSETYIGSMHHQHSFQWVYAEERSKSDASLARRKVVQKECVFVPSLVHIFDEILVNAADNQHRVSAAVDPAERSAADAAAAPQTMTTIRVTLDAASGRISVQNDGASIPVAMHPTERIPIPELIFGHLLTSSNYDDSQQRYTGGRHGFGAKLTNIFSREFKVEIQDVARGRRFEQTFRNNMEARSEAKITSFADLLSSKQAKAKDLTRNYTRISFLPDFARFSEKGLSLDTIAIMKKRVIDVAACVNTNIAVEKGAERTRRKLNPNADPTAEGEAAASGRKIKVYLNDELVDVDSFPKYLDLFPAPGGSKGDASEEAAEGETEGDVPPGKWVFGNINSKWQIAVGPNVAAAAPPASSNAAAAAAALGAGNVSVLSAATRDISFVNSICTSRGGTHVTHVSDKIVRALIDHILRTNKDITRDMLSPSLVRSHMSLLVNCKIPNPSFSSQTKESLMTPAKDFGSECTLSTAFLNQVTASSTGIVPAIVDAIKQKHMVDLLRKQRATAALSKRGKQLQIPKLEDAHWAGSSDASKVAQTTLILTEGDSAKALVLSSLAILGREKYGVFPLKGKLLNVRDASLKAVMDNAEIQNILAIVGLEIGAKYDSGVAGESSSIKGERAARPLRYGRIMLMTDQDHDGSHIKGLLINLLHHFWPELLRRNNFLEEFVTAIIKVKDQRTKIVKQFHTLSAFEAWKSSLPPALLASPEKLRRAYTIKYYKGLGTNTTEEGKEYFRNIAQHRVRFIWDAASTAGNTTATAKIAEKVLSGKGYTHARQVEAAVQALERPGTANASSLLPAPSSSDPGAWINLAFSKSQADARKEWLRTYFSAAACSGVDTSSGELRYKDFINRELIVFSHADNIRSIPSVLDGLKPVQRKILHGCFKRRDLSANKGEIKVAQLSGYISEQTGYHHGEASLQASIIGMAQSFTGSGNNIALLRGLGQFGSRNTGGKDAAAPRYIFTALSPLTRMIFPAADDALLSYKDEDGLQVEPEFFVPILPLVLVNGAEGIGTGFSTTVPTYNPSEIVQQIRARLTGSERNSKLHPWVRGFVGEITPVRAAGAMEDVSSVAATTEGEDPSFMSSASSSAVSFTDPIARYVTSGRVAELSSASSKSSASGSVVFEITELPLGRWLEDYKSSFLSSLLSEARIKKFLDLGGDESIKLHVHVTPEQAAEIRTKGAAEFFKLSSTIQMGNMHLFSSGGAIAKYADPESILAEFMLVRSEFYRRRKEHSEVLLAAEADRLASKIAFVGRIMNDTLRVYKQPKAVLLAKLSEGGFKTALQLLPRIPVYADHTHKPPIKFLNDLGSDAQPKEVENDAYDYLLNMPLSALTAERLAALQSEHDQVAAQLAALQRATPAQLWLADLDKFEQAWNKEMDRKSDSKSKRKTATIEEEAEREDDEEVAEAEIEA